MTTVKTRKQELEKERQRIQAELYEIEEVERKERDAALVGKCFKYHNSFGSGESWWLYLKVVGVGDRYPLCFQFQKDSDGRIEIEPDTFYGDPDNYIPIESAEFESAWAALQAEMGSYSTNGFLANSKA